MHRFATSLSTAAILSAIAAVTACTGSSDSRSLHPGHGPASITDPSTSGRARTASGRLSDGGEATVQLTYYWIAVRPAGDPDEVTIQDCAGNFLTMASASWASTAEMEGTARFRSASGEDVTINAGPGCWITLPSGSWGNGYTDPATGEPLRLAPFRSIAVDRGLFDLGRWYYVKELDGVQLPSPSEGTVHDGCVRAVDIGPAISGDHVDFFVGHREAYGALGTGAGAFAQRDHVTISDGAARCAAHGG